MDKDAEKFEEREKQTKDWLTNQAKRGIALRTKDRQFHGVEREFIYNQQKLLTQYDESKDIKHPRDVGTVREVILRKFLTDSGYLPKRYAVSNRSTRVVSLSGHISNEIDIALFDPLDSFSLMNRQDVFEVLPAESVYGVIQVKSRLNKSEIKRGLANIATFKKLQRASARQTLGWQVNDPDMSDRGFGLLFAYDSDLEWLEIIAEIEAFANANEKRVWTNAIFVLSKGFFLHGSETGCSFTNNRLDKIKRLQMNGRPDRDGLCLFNFHSVLLTLLRTTTIAAPRMEDYFRLPLVAGSHSYQFLFGYFVEFAECSKHGDYQRKINSSQLEKVINWCRSSQPMDADAATDKAFGIPADIPRPNRSPNYVHIYNPENLPLAEILAKPQSLGGRTVEAVAFDAIQTAGMVIYIPNYYSAKEGIIDGCTKCGKS